MMKLATGILAALALSPVALAQHGVLLEPPPVSFQAKPAAPAPPPTPAFESLAKKGEDGRIIRIPGILDLLALRQNSLVDEATIERIRPLVKEWLADVEQIAIDNLDFIEQIEPLDGSPGIIEKFDTSQSDKLHTVSQMMTHLLSAGPLSSYLETKGGFTREQSQLNQTISNDYLQQVMNEVMAEAGLSNNLEQQNKTEEERLNQVNTVSRFLYGMACRDALESYHRLLEITAPNLDKAVAAISPSQEVLSQVQRSVAAAKAARTPDAQRLAVRQAMQPLTFDQRRALLEAGRELAGNIDPLQGHAVATSGDASATR